MSKENSLGAKFPQLLNEWNYDENGSLNPFEVSYGSKKVISWKCSMGHLYEATVNSRTNKRNQTGCPYCSGKKVSSANCLAIVKPDLATEWHPEKNNTLTPFDVSYGSKKIVWWLGRCGHEYRRSISSRALANYDCPSCKGKKATNEVNLLALNPDLASEWHPTKNSYPPDSVRPYSHKKAWWLCKKCGHEWETTIIGRKDGKSCPRCKSYLHTSFPEQAIYYYFKSIFKDTVNRFKFNDNKVNFEIDVYIPSLRLGIEYDGYWHINKSERDELKNEVLTAKGIKLFRIRCNGNYILPSLKPYGSSVLTHLKASDYLSLKDCIVNIFKWINQNCDENNNKLLSNYNMDSFIDISRDETYIAQLYSNDIKENSLKAAYPEI
ncbi:zinc-ribbon domain-containing protein, partial [Brevibacillus brevis]|uniref:zinc-ribbon domain-containing protein n=1 Tax=Brevibacillus brevis TaxID=1393 RepID=UPI001C12BF52